MMGGSNQKVVGAEAAPELKRRRRSAEEKRQIAEASMQPGASVAEIAQSYGVHPSQVFKWRRAYRGELVEKKAPSALLRVRVTDAVHDGQVHATPSSVQQGTIHIQFARAKVSIEGSADAATVRAVLECLAG
jgi:transposase